jgi:hypothetical protein
MLGGPRVDLSGRDALCRILIRLARARAERPGEPLTAADLASSGWPDRAVERRTGANRVRVALSTLRTLGLRGAVTRCRRGWMLDPSLIVVRSE